MEDGPTTASPDPWLVCPELGYLWRDGPSGMPPHPLPLGVNYWSVCRGGGRPDQNVSYNGLEEAEPF